MSSPPRKQDSFANDSTARQFVSTARDESVPGGLAEETTAALVAEPATFEEFDTAGIVEAAEQLLRQAAPHDFDVLIIGSGPAAVSVAVRAAELGARVGLIEHTQHQYGRFRCGEVEMRALADAAGARGVIIEPFRTLWSGSTTAQPALKTVRERAIREAARMSEQIEHLLAFRGIRVVKGRARFVDDHTVEVNSDGERKRWRAVHVVIASGATSDRPHFSGSELEDVITGEELLQHEFLPHTVSVYGDSPFAAQIVVLCRCVGAAVTWLLPGPQPLPELDHEIGDAMARMLRGIGIEVATHVKVNDLHRDGSHLVIRCREQGVEQTWRSEIVLTGTSPRPATADLNLEAIGIALEDSGIVVDECGETSVAGVYAIGGCVRPGDSTHGEACRAAAAGRLVAEYIMNSPSTIDMACIPHCHTTTPQIACAGVSELQAAALDKPIRVARSKFSIGDSLQGALNETLVKLLIDVEAETLIGCHIVGHDAGALIHQAAAAMKSRRSIGELAEEIYSYPFFCDAFATAILQAGGKAP